MRIARREPGSCLNGFGVSEHPVFEVSFVSTGIVEGFLTLACAWKVMSECGLCRYRLRLASFQLVL